MCYRHDANVPAGLAVCQTVLSGALIHTGRLLKSQYHMTQKRDISTSEKRRPRTESRGALVTELLPGAADGIQTPGIWPQD